MGYAIKRKTFRRFDCRPFKEKEYPPNTSKCNVYCPYWKICILRDTITKRRLTTLKKSILNSYLESLKPKPKRIPFNREQYRKENRDELKRRCKLYYSKNKEKSKASQRKHYYKHQEQMKAKSRLYYSKKYHTIESREKYNAYQRKRYQEKKEAKALISDNLKKTNRVNIDIELNLEKSIPIV